MRLSLCCCALLIVVGMAPGSARAQEAAILPGPQALVAGPVLAGDGIAWIGSDRAGEHRLVHAGPGGRRTLRRWRTRAGGERAELAASADVLAVQRSAYRCRGAACRRVLEELLVGPIDGPLTRVAACGLSGAPGCGPRCDTSRVPSVTGRTVAWRFGCRGPLRVRDERGVERSVAARFAPQVAGPFVADEGSGITVRDLDTGVERLRVGGGSRFDLGEDGTIVDPRLVSSDIRNPEFDIVAASPQEPEPRRLATVDGEPDVTTAGGLVAWTSEFGSQVTVARRDGTRVAGGPAPGLASDLSFDGRRMAWAVQPCASYRFAVWSLQGPPPGQTGGCGRLRVRAARLSRDRRSVRLAVRCPKAPLGGCGVTLSGSLRRGGRRVAVVEEGLTRLGIEPGARRRLRLRVRPADRAAAGRATTLRLRIAGETRSPRRRSITVRLR